MKDYSYHKKVIDDVITKLNESDIDLYLIITAEGCDPMTEFIPGVDTVGSSAFLFTKDGKKLATASSIDAQDVEESGLFANREKPSVLGKLSVAKTQEKTPTAPGTAMKQKEDIQL